MCDAGALFLPGAGLPPGVEDLIVPGKTYEYLASCRPILGALACGDARTLVERSGGGYVCEPCSEESIMIGLRRLHADWTRGELDDGSFRDREILASFDRVALARRLSEHLQAVNQMPPRET